MSFRTLFIQNRDTTVSYIHETFNEAAALFHQEQGYRAEGRNYCYGVIYDENMMEIKKEIYDKNVDRTDHFTVLVNQNEEVVTPYSYTSENDARALFHQELAYRADGRDSTRVAIINSNFSTIAWDQYIKEVVPPNGEE